MSGCNGADEFGPLTSDEESGEEFHDCALSLDKNEGAAKNSDLHFSTSVPHNTIESPVDRVENPAKQSMKDADKELIDRVIEEASADRSSPKSSSSIFGNSETIRDSSEFSHGDAASMRSDSCSQKAKKEAENDEDTEFGVDEERLTALDAEQSAEDLEERQKQAETLKNDANTVFKSGNMAAAASLYTDALRKCPLSAAKLRAVLYSNRAACRAALVANSVPSAADRRCDDSNSLISSRSSPLAGALSDCSKALELDGDYERARRRHARLLERAGGDHLERALEEWRELLRRIPGDPESTAAVCRLPAAINERNEKLKTEMLSKLKDLGNMVLKPFGMSTNNFKMEPTDSGGYNIKFSQ